MTSFICEQADTRRGAQGSGRQSGGTGSLHEEERIGVCFGYVERTAQRWVDQPQPARTMHVVDNGGVCTESNVDGRTAEDTTI